MTEEKSKKSNVAFYFAGGITIAAIVMVVLLVLRGPVLGASFFNTDDKKYVISSEDITLGAIKSHIVYYHDGDNVTNVEKYLEFKDSATAKKVFDEFKKEISESDKSQYDLSGIYIVEKYPESYYQDLDLNSIKEESGE
jgi:hypothetical protein